MGQVVFMLAGGSMQIYRAVSSTAGGPEAAGKALDTGGK
jgi:hypothetical protein